MTTQDSPSAPTPAAEASSTPTMRRICCVVAPRHRSASIADHLRAAAVWAQIVQDAAAARTQAAQEAAEAE